MSLFIIVLCFIVIFIGFIIVICDMFPVIPTTIYDIFGVFIDYVSNATGILWFFVPKTLTLALVAIVLVLEAVMLTIKIFLFIFRHLKP